MLLFPEALAELRVRVKQPGALVVPHLAATEPMALTALGFPIGLGSVAVAEQAAMERQPLAVGGLAVSPAAVAAVVARRQTGRTRAPAAQAQTDSPSSIPTEGPGL